MPDYGFRWQIIGIACVNTVVCIFLEDIVTEKFLVKIWKKFGRKTKTRYNEVEHWMQTHLEWPCISALPSVAKTKAVNKNENKAYPFTVEVIDEANPKLDFKTDEIHANAHVLNSSSS